MTRPYSRKNAICFVVVWSAGSHSHTPILLTNHWALVDTFSKDKVDWHQVQQRTCTDSLNSVLKFHLLELTCNDNGRYTNHICSYLLQQLFVRFGERIDFSLTLLIYVNKYWPKLVVFIQALTYQSFRCGKLQSVSASRPMLGQHLYCYTTWQILQKIACARYPSSRQKYLVLCSNRRYVVHPQFG